METSWPTLRYGTWQETGATLQRYAQIVGKIRLGLVPRLNHYWGVAFHLTARGLSTGPMLANGRLIDIEFDFVDHQLRVRTDGSEDRHLALDGRPVAVFYRNLGTLLSSLGIDVRINDRPVEIPTDDIPFHADFLHATYDRAEVDRFWKVLWQSALLLEGFAARFVGKQSPVHFFWGSFDLALTRFSGNRAPDNPQADAVMREAYSHEVISHGFWPGGAGFDDAAFYAYAAPEPEGLATAKVRPEAARYDNAMNVFVLPYEAVRAAASPEAELMSFLETTYREAATLARWDRSRLER